MLTLTASRMALIALVGLGLTGCSAVAEEASQAAMESFDCDDLAQDAVRASEGKTIELLKVRSPRMLVDNRTTYSEPTGTGESLILKCEGMGVWSDGSNSSVVIKSTIDADGDTWTQYQG